MFLILFLHGPFTPKAIYMQSVHFCSFLETSIYILMYCLKFMLKNYTCKYCKIGRCDDDIYVKRYVGVLRIYIYDISSKQC